jgi:hypothetical protein
MHARGHDAKGAPGTHMVRGSFHTTPASQSNIRQAIGQALPPMLDSHALGS